MNYFIDPEKPVTFVCKDDEVTNSVCVWLNEDKAFDLPLHPSQAGRVLQGGKTYRMVQLSDGTFGFEEELAACRK